MGKTGKSEKERPPMSNTLDGGPHKAQVVLPDPLLAEHWVTYWEKFDQYLAEGNRPTSPGVMLRAKYLAALAICDSVTYVWKGEKRDALAEGMRAQLAVTRWVAHIVDERLSQEWEVPKD